MKALLDGTCPTGELGISHFYLIRNKDLYEIIQYRIRNLLPTPEDHTDKNLSEISPPLVGKIPTAETTWGCGNVKPMNTCLFLVFQMYGGT